MLSQLGLCEACGLVAMRLSSRCAAAKKHRRNGCNDH